MPLDFQLVECLALVGCQVPADFARPQRRLHERGMDRQRTIDPHHVAGRDAATESVQLVERVVGFIRSDHEQVERLAAVAETLDQLAEHLAHLQGALFVRLFLFMLAGSGQAALRLGNGVADTDKPALELDRLAVQTVEQSRRRLVATQCVESYFPSAVGQQGLAVEHVIALGFKPLKRSLGFGDCLLFVICLLFAHAGSCQCWQCETSGTCNLTPSFLSAASSTALAQADGVVQSRRATSSINFISAGVKCSVKRLDSGSPSNGAGIGSYSNIIANVYNSLFPQAY